jgi:hypothetical protein
MVTWQIEELKEHKEAKKRKRQKCPEPIHQKLK